MELPDFITALATIAIAIIAFITMRRERYLKRLKHYLFQTPYIESLEIPTVLLGPRLAGKTKIARRLANPWTSSLDHFSPTQGFETHKFQIFKFDKEKFYQEETQMERNRRMVLEIAINDYGGEDENRIKALERLQRGVNKASLIFVFLVDYEDSAVSGQHTNEQYFSKSYLNEIEDRFNEVTRSTLSVHIVFNKSDLLPKGWHNDEAIKRLKEANTSAIQRIESVFGGRTHYHLTSAKNDIGILDLLGSISAEFIKSHKHLDAFKALIENSKSQRLNDSID